MQMPRCVCLCLSERERERVCEGRRTTWSQFSTPIPWISGIEIMSSGLAASPFTHSTTPQPNKLTFDTKNCLESNKMVTLLS